MVSKTIFNGVLYFVLKHIDNSGIIFITNKESFY